MLSGKRVSSQRGNIINLNSLRKTRKDSDHLQVEGACGVSFPEKERKVRTSPSWRLMWLTSYQTPKELNFMSQKSTKRSSWVNAQDIKLPESCQESSLSMWNSFSNIFFISIAFIKLRMFSSLFISRKWITSFKKLNNNKILNLILDFIELASIRGNTLSRKRWNIFHTDVHISIILNQL